MKAVPRFARDFRRFFRWFGKSRKPPVISVDDPHLAVVVRAFDETAAASAVLDAAQSWEPDEPAVLRHHIRLPTAEIDTARGLLESDGWTLRTEDDATDQGNHGQKMISAVALRVQKLDALHCSQESSRMAGLAQRLGGTSLGWDALQQLSGPAQVTDYSAGGVGR